MDEMGFQVPVGHKDRGEKLEQQPLAHRVVGWSTQGGEKLAVQVSQELSWCMQGGANYLCMPDDPDYLRYSPGVQGYSYVYGTQYDTYSNQPLSAVLKHNAPCAVCYASTRGAVTMIPAKIRYPSTWTLEYSGYLMSQYHVRVC